MGLVSTTLVMSILIFITILLIWILILYHQLPIMLLIIIPTNSKVFFMTMEDAWLVKLTYFHGVKTIGYFLGLSISLKINGKFTGSSLALLVLKFNRLLWMCSLLNKMLPTTKKITTGLYVLRLLILNLDF